jgi:hypothetical membrane protein
MNGFPPKRIAGLCGLLAPLIAFICIGTAILLSPWFSWTRNYLSDLGGFPGMEPIYAAHGPSSILFNVGLIMAGGLGIILGLGVRKLDFMDSLPAKAGTIFFILDAAFLTGIGIFPETTGEPHTIFSIAFFVTIGICLLFMSITLFRTRRRKLARLTLILLLFGMIAIPLFITPKPVGSNAVAEMVPIISVAVFSIAFGYELLSDDMEGKT